MVDDWPCLPLAMREAAIFSLRARLVRVLPMAAAAGEARLFVKRAIRFGAGGVIDGAQM